MLAEAIGILSKWGLGFDRSYKILGISNQSESMCQECAEKAYVLTQIDKVLNQLFDNPENANAFMSLQNHNGFFTGHTPIGIIEKGNIIDVQEVYTRINAIMSPW